MFWGHENIKGLKSTTIKDYWQWTYSDLLIESNRSSLGLFIIAHALELTKIPRINWGNVDLRYKRKKISVDICSRIQDWKQSKSNRILFNISRKKGIHAKNDRSLTFKNREADLYVFGLHKEKDLKNADFLNLEQWDFYVVLTKVLDENFPKKNKLGIGLLNSIAEPIPFKDIQTKVNDLIENKSNDLAE